MSSPPATAARRRSGQAARVGRLAGIAADEVEAGRPQARAPLGWSCSELAHR